MVFKRIELIGMKTYQPTDGGLLYLMNRTKELWLRDSKINLSDCQNVNCQGTNLEHLTVINSELLMPTLNDLTKNAIKLRSLRLIGLYSEIPYNFKQVS